MKHLLFVFVVIMTYGCSTIADESISQALEGNWEAFEIIDVPTNDTLRLSGFSYTLGGKGCDAFRLFDDKSFNVYYQNGSDVFGTSTGVWDSEFNDLILDFDNGFSIVRTVSIGNDILTMPDTIFGRAKVVRFEKVL